jgi:hypothetical protein
VKRALKANDVLEKLEFSFSWRFLFPTVTIGNEFLSFFFCLDSSFKTFDLCIFGLCARVPHQTYQSAQGATDRLIEKILLWNTGNNI